MSRKKFNYKRKLPINRYDLGSFLGLTDDKGKITAGAGGIANAFAGIANTLINPSSNTTGVGNVMSSLGSVASNIPGVGGLIGAGVNLLGGLTNAAFGSNINEAAVSNIKSNIANQAATTFDYSSSDNLIGDWSNYSDLARVKTSDIGSDGWFSDKAKNKAKELDRQAQEANMRALANFANAANNLDVINTQTALVNYGANGGPLTMRYTGIMSPFGSRFSDGGKIHIKPSKKGTFTAAAKKRGMGVQEFASKVLANKENYSTAMVKKANFARNASKWKHADGGPLSDSEYYSIMERVAKDNYKKWGFKNVDEALAYSLNDNTYNYRGYYSKYPKSRANADTHWSDEFKTVYHPTFSNESVYSGKVSQYNPEGLIGGSWNGETFIPADWQNKKAEGGSLFTNGITMIGNGGTHELNPMEGVLMGVDNQGIPNLVEEGELIWNDYVFSNRLKVPKAIRQKYKLKEDITFAEATKKLQKESEERPNDPISKNGLNAIMSEMALTLEEIRMKKEKNKYAKGGKLGKLYDGLGEDSNLLETITSELLLAMLDSGKTDFSIPYDATKEDIDKIAGVGELKRNNYSSYLRYAPIVNTGLSMLSDAFGVTNKPDYTPIENIMDAANRASRVNKVIAPRISNYMTYNPIDVNYLANRQAAEAAANRRAIADMSGGNRANYMANLLAADYASQRATGETLMQAMEANRAQRQAVEEFNRGTNTTNAKAAMKAAQINQAAEQLAKATRLVAIERAEKMRNQIDAASSAAISANRNAFFRDLGNLGRENYFRNVIDNAPWLLYDSDNKYKRKNGGCLTVKNKRRK